MPRPETTLQDSAPRKGRKYFSLAEAGRALPLVKRIAADVQATQARRIRLHAELNADVVDNASEATRKSHAELEMLTTRLEALIDELTKIGVELKDPARALLDFPAIHEGREVLLCWKGDEATITHWHEIDGGFAGRRPVEELHDHQG